MAFAICTRAPQKSNASNESRKNMTPLLKTTRPVLKAAIVLAVLFLSSLASAQSFQNPCEDVDGDGYTTCENDCDDNNAAIHPGQNDASCDGVDNNCDGSIDDDYVVYQSLCGVGACMKYGNVFCVGGAFGYSWGVSDKLDLFGDFLEILSEKWKASCLKKENTYFTSL